MVAAIDLSDELVRGLLAFVFVAILGGAAGLIWGNAKFQHELDVKAVERFRDLYGTWFATWKGWEEALDQKHTSFDDPVAIELLKQATEVEGSFEVLTVKIATSRHLTDDQLRHLGRFREGYQQLRESIEKREKLPFRVQYDDDAVKAYVAFKALSVEFARLLRGRGRRWSRPKTWWWRPTLEEAQEAMVRVTSWRTTGDRKTSWWHDAGSDSATKAVEQLQALKF